MMMRTMTTEATKRAVTTVTTSPVTTTEATTESPPRPAFARFSVRTRITVAFALLVALALAGAGLVVYALESARIEQSLSREIEQELAEFNELRRGNDPLTAQPFRDAHRLIRVFLSRNVPDDNEVLYGLSDRGQDLASGGARSEELARDPAFRDAVAALERTGGSTRIDTRWGEVIVTVQPVRDDTSSAEFVIASFLRDEQRELNQVMQTYAIVAALSLGLVTATAAWQAGRLLSPVRTLTDTARDITETDLSRRIPESGNDDLTDLTRTVNEMLARLDQAFRDQREFLDDAGHELKTPLTVLRGHLELLDRSDPEEVDATRELLLDEVDRMSRLVGDLILLAKADRPDFVRLAPVDVAPFTATVLEKCRALGERRWQLDARAEAHVDLDEQRMTQALLQLAQNAVAHTSAADTVAVGSRVEGDELRLWVADTGPGVREEDKAVIFDRFARGPGAVRDDGFGLGLSIVRAIVAAHGGAVTVEDVAPTGARFVISLPARREDGPWHAS